MAARRGGGCAERAADVFGIAEQAVGPWGAWFRVSASRAR